MLTIFMGAALALAIPPASQIQFTEQTQQAGLSWTQDFPNGHPGASMTGGGTVADFNRDGWPDLFIVGGGLEPDRLYLNDGDGSFTDHAAAWGLTALHRGCAAAAGDVDGDGWPDLFVTSFGDMSGPVTPGGNLLFRNLGGTGFAEIGAQAGVNDNGLPGGGMSACFGDYDLDGDLDLYVTTWANGSDGNRLYRNEGGLHFTDVTVAAGLYTTTLRGFTPRFADMDGDRYPELLVAADFNTSRYFINNRDGTFTDYTVHSGAVYIRNGMGATVGDFNRDGRFDWYATDIYRSPTLSGNNLFWNQGGHLLNLAPHSAGAHDGGWGWGATTIDLDHDGWQDIVATNGWESRGPDHTRIYRNQGDSTFLDVALSSGLVHMGLGRCLLHLDSDQDGDMDLVIVSHEEALAYYENQPPAANANWLQVVLDTSAHPGLAPDGIGSRLRLTAGGATQHYLLDGGPTFLGCSEPVAHFGVAGATVIDELVVEWNDGFETVLTNVAVNQKLTVAAAPPLEQDPLVRGTAVATRVRGAESGETVWFLFSLAGTAQEVCKPQLGGMCLDLMWPLHVFGSPAADAGGTAQVVRTLPANAPLITVHTQAVVRRGPGGTHSAKTNVVAAQVQP